MITVKDDLYKVAVGMIALGKDGKSVDFVGEMVTVNLTFEEIEAAAEIARDCNSLND
jgi:hypothetical protein